MTTAHAAPAPGRPAADRDHGVERDRGVDAVRALAIAGVVLGHWLVTALVLRPDGTLAVASPLTTRGELAPVSWLLQTLALFFFAAGFGAARSRFAARSRLRHRPAGRSPRRSGARLRGLLGPAARFGGLWAVALVAAALAGAPAASLRTVATLAVSPLWFLAVLVVLTGLAAPILAVAARRRGAAITAGAAAVVVVASDAGHGWAPVTVLAAWLVPYVLGAAAATGRLGGRRTALALAVGGLAALLALILGADYPVSAVGVPGDDRSNLNPPSLAAVGLGLAQIGAARLAQPRLAAWARRRAWLAAPVDAVNRAAMPIYLWHQSVLIAVTLLVMRLSGSAPVPGLLSPPDASWLPVRLLWLPVLGGGLALVTLRRTRRRPVRPGCTMSCGSEPGRPCGGDRCAK